jgi:hypothetical protein
MPVIPALAGTAALAIALGPMARTPAASRRKGRAARERARGHWPSNSSGLGGDYSLKGDPARRWSGAWNKDWIASGLPKGGGWSSSALAPHFVNTTMLRSASTAFSTNSGEIP